MFYAEFNLGMRGSKMRRRSLTRLTGLQSSQYYMDNASSTRLDDKRCRDGEGVR